MTTIRIYAVRTDDPTAALWQVVWLARSEWTLLTKDQRDAVKDAATQMLTAMRAWEPPCEKGDRA